MNAVLPPLPATVRTLTTEQSQRLSLTYPSLPTVKNCITCHGRKTFRWYFPIASRDMSQVADYTCDCVGQYILHRRFLHAGIGETYQRLGWDDGDHIPADAITKAMDYLVRAEAYVSAGFGLVIHGDGGTGKTLLSNLILKDLVAAGFDCYSNTFSTMIDSLSAGWSDKDDRKWFTQRVRNAGVLLIDDLFRERNKGVGTLGENVLEETLRHRIARSKPTIITMNPDPAEVGKVYGGHTVSLLAERAKVLPFVGTNHREEIQGRLDAEILAGLTRPIVVS